MEKLIQTPDFRYREDVDREDDNIKTFHEAYDVKGNVYHMDFSPYFKMTQEAFELWLNCGMPDRETLGLKRSITVEDLRELASLKATGF